MPDYTRPSYRIKEALVWLLKAAGYCLTVPIGMLLLFDYMFLHSAITMSFLQWLVIR